MKRFVSLLLAVSLLILNLFYQCESGIIAHADDYEYAWFPLTYIDVNQVCFENASHQGSYHIDCNSATGSDGWVHAPFTGKIVAYTTNYSCALFQSIDKVHYADGSLDYMTLCLEHGSNITDLQNYYKNGTIINQGSAFYKAGGIGKGGQVEFGVHFDFGVCRGKQNTIQALTEYAKSKGYTYSGCGNMYPFDALFINRGFTKGVGTNRGYGRNINGTLVGVPSGVIGYDNYNGLWKDLDTTPLPCDIKLSGFQNPTEGYVHTPGDPCGMYGTITSNHPLKHIWGGVYNLDLTAAPGKKTTCDDYPNTTSYSLRGKFNDIYFNDIPVGNYIFSISAEDSDGYAKEIYHCNFTVGNPVTTYTVNFNANGGSGTMSAQTIQCQITIK